MQFATLEIEINLQREDRNTKATMTVAFYIGELSALMRRHTANFNGWTNLAITPLERRI